MKKVVLNKLSIRNFKGIESLDIEFDPVVTRIYGSNGAGKTSIKNAWEWVLGQKVSEYIPNLNNKELNVETSVEADIVIDEYNYKLKRVSKPKFSGGEKTGNELLYYIDDIEIQAKNYLSQIASILSENAVDNIQILTDKEFFNTDTTSWKWTNRRKLLMEMCGVYEATKDIIEQDKYILIREDIEKGYATSDIKSRYEKSRKTAKENQLKNIALIEQKQKEINEYLGIDFDEKTQTLANLKQKYTKMLNSSKKENCSDELKQMQDDLYKYASELSALQVKNTLEKQKLESEKTQYYKEATSIKGEIDAIMSETGLCPYCKQPLPKELLDQKDEDLEDLRTQYRNTYNKFQEVSEKLAKWTEGDRVYELEELIADLNSKLQNTKLADLNKATAQKQKELEEQISELERVVARKDDLAKWNKQIQDWKKENLALADEIVDYETKMRILQDYVREQTDIVSKTVNDKFSNGVSWSLYDVNYIGTLEENCTCLYNNKIYSSLSTGERNVCNVEVLKTLQDYFNINTIIFCDNQETVTIPYETDRQIVELYASIPQDKQQLEFIKLNANKIKGEK